MLEQEAEEEDGSRSGERSSGLRHRTVERTKVEAGGQGLIDGSGRDRLGFLGPLGLS